MTGAFVYPGSELQLFEKAVQWKKYWRSHLQAYVHGDVLEVGAGIGANTRYFTGSSIKSWTCLEPDPLLFAELRKSVSGLPKVRTVAGTLLDLAPTEKFDCILYIDVLEHIPDDKDELRRAADSLRSTGTLLALGPAHGWLFSPFDTAIGHFRRYSANSLRAAAPSCLDLRVLRYLDSVGMLASLGNRLLLKSSQPSETQILFWDRWLVPVSRFLDPVLGYRCGKSVLAVWQKQRSDRESEA